MALNDTFYILGSEEKRLFLFLQTASFAIFETSFNLKSAFLADS